MGRKPYQGSSIAFVDQLETTFLHSGDPERGEKMAAYMKGLFPFYGVNSPQRKETMRTIFQDIGIPTVTQCKEIAGICWERDHREMQYAGMSVLEKSLRDLTEEDIPFLLSLVRSKSWWDTVDWIAPTALGSILRSRMKLLRKLTSSWIKSENIWLQRSAILCQLKYKSETDKELLFELIGSRAGSTEFFVRTEILS